MEEEAQEPGEPERPLKRLRLKYQGQASESCNNPTSLAGTSFITPKDEPVELPEVHPRAQLQSMVGTSLTNNGNMRIESQHLSCESLDRSKGKQPVSPKPLTIQERTGTIQHVSADRSQTNIPTTIESGAVPHQMSLRNRGKEAFSPHFASVEKRLESERSSQAAPKDKIVDGQILLQPKEEPFTGDTLVFDLPLPLAVIHPGTFSL